MCEAESCVECDSVQLHGHFARCVMGEPRWILQLLFG